MKEDESILKLVSTAADEALSQWFDPQRQTVAARYICCTCIPTNNFSIVFEMREVKYFHDGRR